MNGSSARIPGQGSGPVESKPQPANCSIAAVRRQGGPAWTSKQMSRDIPEKNGAQEKTRTSTTVRPLAPEASASTNSATWARGAAQLRARGRDVNYCAEQNLQMRSGGRRAPQSSQAPGPGAQGRAGGPSGFRPRKDVKSAQKRRPGAACGMRGDCPRDGIRIGPVAIRGRIEGAPQPREETGNVTGKLAVVFGGSGFVGRNVVRCRPDPVETMQCAPSPLR